MPTRSCALTGTTSSPTSSRSRTCTRTAQRQWNAEAKRLLLGEPLPVRTRVSGRRRGFLVGFFALAWVYRTLVMIGIVTFVADQYWGLGLVGAAAIAYSSFVMPLRETGETTERP